MNPEMYFEKFYLSNISVNKLCKKFYHGNNISSNIPHLKNIKHFYEKFLSTTCKYWITLDILRWNMWREDNKKEEFYTDAFRNKSVLENVFFLNLLD